MRFDVPKAYALAVAVVGAGVDVGVGVGVGAGAGHWHRQRRWRPCAPQRARTSARLQLSHTVALDCARQFTRSQSHSTGARACGDDGCACSADTARTPRGAARRAVRRYQLNASITCSHELMPE